MYLRALVPTKGTLRQEFIDKILVSYIEADSAASDRVQTDARRRLRRRALGRPCQLSQRCRRKIGELFGEAKELHGLRRLRRRTLENVREDV